MNANKDRLPRVGVVTVAYRSDDVLPAFLDSIRASTGVTVSIAVADNCPAEGDGARSAAAAVDAVYLPLDHNPGYGAAANAGVAALGRSVDWLLISNPDVIVEPDTISTLVSSARATTNVGAVGPRVLNPDGSTYPSARAVPSLRTGIGHALFVRFWPGNPFTARYHQADQPASGSRDTGWLSGACLLLPRHAFERVGGFDEGYFMYFEDVDLGYRLGKAGLRSIYEPAAVVTHTGAHSTDGESAAMLEAHHDSARRFINAKYRGWALWPLRVVISTGLRVRAAVLSRTTRP